MLKARIIPFLLLRDSGLTKTVQFKNGKYVGDPLNAVKIFNEKEADELTFLDIDASVQNKSPNFKLLEKIAEQARMPICYGGGINNVEHAKRIIELGIEKIAISSAGINNFNLLEEIGSSIGVQSVVCVLDYKKSGFFGKQEIFTQNGTKKSGIDLFDHIKKLNSSELIGELVINGIDHDGTSSGYDYDTIQKVREIFDGPLTVIGGCKDHDDIHKLIKQFPVIGAGVGSSFVFKGKYKAVLINYPTKNEKDKILSNETVNSII